VDHIAATPTGQAAPALRDGGRILVDALRIHGVDRVFGVPGESSLPIFDALRDAAAGVEFVVCRHEAAASHMAEADGKMLGRPGVCLVSRGPGAMHAAVGIHTAFMDSTPMILLIGQVPRRFRGRGAFQEMDYTRVFASTSKWAAEIEDPALIPEYLSRAFHIAVSGRPGPVILSLPEDMLEEECIVADLPRFVPSTPAPQPDLLARMRILLQEAKRPLVILGGTGWTPQAFDDLQAFVTANDLPVATAFRSQHLIDNRSENYIGDLGLGMHPDVAARVAGADLLLVIGDHLGEVVTRGYRIVTPPQPQQRLIHVHQDGDELGRVYHTELPIQSGAAPFAAAARQLPPVDASAWRDWRREARESYEARHTPPPASNAGVDLAQVCIFLRDRLPADSIVTNGAGNYAGWVHRFHSYRQLGSQLAPKSGCMGYGLPAAIAAQLRYPGRKVVAFAGDGCFMMAAPDFATAVQYGLPIVVIVVNNGMYGSIRMHQERRYPGRPSATDLRNPDFAAMAGTYGAHGELVTETADFAPAFERALASGLPALIELRTDPEQITPDATISRIRGTAVPA
jgi:acetolactate synthase-1/2/3 large subunit